MEEQEVEVYSESYTRKARFLTRWRRLLGEGRSCLGGGVYTESYSGVRHDSSLDGTNTLSRTVDFKLWRRQKSFGVYQGAGDS